MPARHVEDHKWWTLTAVCVATFMLLIDITIVNVALPDIAKALHSSFTDLQWVIDAYALSLAALLLTWGATSDRVGRRYIFVVGLGIFTVASLGCALSTSPLMLNLARAVQGVGGAAMFATSLALLASAFHGRERGTAVGIWGATIGAAVAIGPLVGGALTESIGWESIFFINVPIGIAAIYISLTRVAESKDPNAGPNDWLGLITLLGRPLPAHLRARARQRRGLGQHADRLVPHRRRRPARRLRRRRGAHPLPRCSTSRCSASRPSAGRAIAAFALSASMFSMFLYLTLYLQNGLGLSPLQAGVRFLPLSLLSFLVAPLAGRMSARVPIRALIGGGMFLVAIALLLMRGLSRLLGVDRAAARLHRRRHRRRARQRAAGVDRGQRRPAGARRHGLGHQLDLPPGRASRPAPPASAPSSSTSWPTTPRARSRTCPPRSSRRGARPVPGPVAHTAYLALFTDGLNDILLVAAIVAFAGAVLSFVLIRGSDFVPTARARRRPRPSPS